MILYSYGVGPTIEKILYRNVLRIIQNIYVKLPNTHNKLLIFTDQFSGPGRAVVPLTVCPDWLTKLTDIRHTKSA